MSSGIRIRDKDNSFVSIELRDILSLIEKGGEFSWSILFLWATGDLGAGRSIPDFEEEVRLSKSGIHMDWPELVSLSEKFQQTIDIVAIGCGDEANLRRFETDEEMYRECDLVIVMFDSSYWEIYSKDSDLIDRMEKHFKYTERLPEI